MNLNLGVIIVPFALMAVLCWYVRCNIVIKGIDGETADRKIPRGILFLGLLAGLAPILNIITLIAAIVMLLFYDKIGFANTRLNKYLNG